MNIWNSFSKAGTWSATSCLFVQRFLAIFILDNKHVIIRLIIPLMTSWTITYFVNDFWIPNVARMITGSVLFIFASSLLVESPGRRERSSISDSVMAVCLGILAFYCWLREHGVDVSSYNLIPFISFGVYFSTFALGFGPIPYVTIGEVFGPQVIGFAIGIVCVFASLVEFCVVKTYRILLEAARGYELADVDVLKRRFAAAFPPSCVLDSPEPLEVAVADAPRTIIDARIDALEEAVRSLSAELAALKEIRAPKIHAVTINTPTIQAPKILMPQTRTITPKSTWCYYHVRFGKDSRKCGSNLCTFSPKILPQNQTFKNMSDKPEKFTDPYSTWTDF